MEASRIHCPFKPLNSISWMPPMHLSQVTEIEKHISTSSCHHPPLKDLVFHGAIDGTTPLLLACYCGSLDAVKRIVKNWGVNVRTTAVYYMKFRPNMTQHEKFGNVTWIKISNSSPLFVAAHNGHLDIVRFLLENGAADLLTKTACSTHIQYDGLTPLHGALFDCVFENKEDAVSIARLLLEAGADPSVLPTDQAPIWMKSLCGFGSVTALINHGLDLTQRDPNSSITILHHWASPSGKVTYEQSLSIVKLAVNKGADLLARDRHGFSPILTAAAGGNFSVLDYLLERDEIPRIDKIDAAELAGSVILGTSQYDPRRLKALEYWRIALLLRQMNEPIHKIPLNFKKVKTVEWATHEQLEEFIHNRSKYWINSIFIQLRFVVARKTWKAFNTFLSLEKSDYTYYLFRQVYKPNEISNILDVLWTKLEFSSIISQSGIDTLHSTPVFLNWIHDASRFLVSILSIIQRCHPLLLTVEIMKTSIELISDTDNALMADCLGITTEDRMVNLLQLIELLGILPHMLIETGREKTKVESSKTPETIIKESLADLVQRERRDKKGRTFLHIACNESYLSRESPDRFFAVIRLLVDFGADPNAVDADRNGPLHFLAKLNGEMVDAAADLLLVKGAHFDRVNKAGKTAADAWIESHEGANGWCDRPSWLRDSVPLPLECQCARVIRDNQVSYIKLLPESLCHFVKMHE